MLRDHPSELTPDPRLDPSQDRSPNPTPPQSRGIWPLLQLILSRITPYPLVLTFLISACSNGGGSNPTTVQALPPPAQAPTQIPNPAATASPPESTAPTPDPNSPTPDPNSPAPDPNSPTPDPNSPAPDPSSPTPDPNSPTPADPAAPLPSPTPTGEGDLPTPTPSSISSPDPGSTPSPIPTSTATPSPDPSSTPDSTPTPDLQPTPLSTPSDPPTSASLSFPESVILTGGFHQIEITPALSDPTSHLQLGNHTLTGLRVEGSTVFIIPFGRFTGSNSLAIPAGTELNLDQPLTSDQRATIRDIYGNIQQILQPSGSDPSLQLTLPPDQISRYYDGDPEQVLPTDAGIIFGMAQGIQNPNDLFNYVNDVLQIPAAFAAAGIPLDFTIDSVISANQDPQLVSDFDGDGDRADVEDALVLFAMSQRLNTIPLIETFCSQVAQIPCPIVPGTVIPGPGATPFPSFPGILKFEASLYIAGEGSQVPNPGPVAPFQPIAVVQVERIDGSDGLVSAQIDLNSSDPGTATGGSPAAVTTDYDNTIFPITVQFADGDTTPQAVSIPVQADELPELDETINLVIVPGSATGGATIGPVASTTLTLLNDDGGFVVNSVLDEVDLAIGNGVCATASSVCTLRAAIQEANAQPGTQTITFDPDTTNGIPIQLSLAGADEDQSATGDLDIREDLTIIANGSANTIIDGGSIDRIFDLNPGGVVTTVSMSGMTLRGGAPASTGGAILNRAGSDLTADDLIITNNSSASGGGVRNDGSFSLSNSSVIANFVTPLGGFDGGGINNTGDLILNTVVINNNTAPQFGGGIATTGSLIMTDSTLSNNTASGGGGLYIEQTGSPVTVDLIDTDVVSNVASTGDGGGIKAVGTVILNLNGGSFQSNTAAGDGGGLFVEPTVNLTPQGIPPIGIAIVDGISFFDNLPNNINSIPIPVITITATDPNANEEGLDPGQFTITLDQAAAADLDVAYMVDGSATDPDDFTASPLLTGTILIPAGETDITIDIIPVDDGDIEGSEDVVLTLQDGASYDLGTPIDATVTIADNDFSIPPVITLPGPGLTYVQGDPATIIDDTAEVADADSLDFDTGSLTVQITAGADPSADILDIESQGTGPGEIEFDGTTVSFEGVAIGTVSGGSGGTPLIVNFSGSAATQLAVEALVQSITFESTSATAGDRTVSFQLDDGDGEVSDPATQTVTLSLAALPVINITATDPDADETGSDDGTFTVTRTDTVGDLTVNYSIGGTAANDGSDFVPVLSGTITILDGATDVVFVITPVDDTDIEGDETVVLDLTADPTYQLGTSLSATVTIVDNDVNAPPVLTLPGPALNYIQGSPPIVIDPTSTVTDDSLDFNTGSLTVEINPAVDPAEDTLSIEDQGTGVGQIGFDGTLVTFAGNLIGTASGGSGGVPLSISFTTADATLAAAEALVRAITFESNSGIFADRALNFQLEDGDGGIGTATQTVTLTSGLIVTNTNDSGPGSLRDAITLASTLGIPNTISFAIPNPGPHLIAVTSGALPPIPASVVLDATTQPGTDCAAGSLQVVIDGSSLGTGSGLSLQQGNTAVQGFVIQNFPDNGILIDTAADNNVITCNFIGVQADGITAAGNGTGIRIDGQQFNMIGGIVPEDRNVISGNLNHGIQITGVGASNNTIQGNFIGTDLTGSGAIPNAVHGIFLESGNGDVIGSTNSGTACDNGCNLISGNTGGAGIQIDQTTTSSITILGNYIGTDLAGDPTLGNDIGIAIIGASGNAIGADTPGQGNRIQGNIEEGIRIIGESAISNQILGNSIVENGTLGIDLGSQFGLVPDGVTSNDLADLDSGPNSLQNFPGLSLADPDTDRITGSLNSAPDTDFRIQFFANSSCDPSGHGEGDQYLGAIDVTTDTSGFVLFDSDVDPGTGIADFAAGEAITATATRLDVPLNTSEFSSCLTAIPGGSPIVDTIADDPDANIGDGLCQTALGECSLRAAIQESNTIPGKVITFDPLLNGETILLTTTGSGEDLANTGDLDIRVDMTIQGNGELNTIINGNGIDRVFHVVDPGLGSVTISDLTISGGDTTSEGTSGGGIYNQGGLTNLSLFNVVVQGNTADTGGGIWNEGVLTLEDVQVSSNTAVGSTGGGISNTGDLIAIRGVINNNAADGGVGGGIYSLGNVDLDNTIIDLNIANLGGGIFNDDGGEATLQNAAVVSRNTAIDSGGGIYNFGVGSLVEIEDSSQIIDNQAEVDGGGIKNRDQAVLVIRDSTLINNNESTSGSGGGLFNGDASVTLLSGTAITNNRALNMHGGGIFHTGSFGSLQIEDTTIANNLANAGGGVWIEGVNTTIDHSTVARNQADVLDGGGLYVISNLSLLNSTIADNVSADRGGGIFVAGTGTVDLSFTSIGFNVSTNTGGGVYNNDGGTVAARGALIAENSGLLVGQDFRGPLESSDFNLLGTSLGLTVIDIIPIVGDLLDGNADLQPLTHNGGLTETLGLGLSSDAIDGVLPGECTDLSGNPVDTDQRGVGRPQGTSCDIGSFEHQ